MARREYPSYEPNQDAYRILGAHPDDSAEEVEQAYRRAALTWHPDKCPAPDAAERFHQVLEAGKILRDQQRRADYDRLRAFHLGPQARKERRSRFTRTAPPKPPPTYAPLNPPPAWMSERVSIHFDAMTMRLELPVPKKKKGRIPMLLGGVVAGMGIWAVDPLIFSLSLVFFLWSYVASRPPYRGLDVWAKIAPARKEAEYHALNRRASHYEQLTVPYRNLAVTVLPHGAQYQVQISGFPHGAVPVLHRTSDLEEANRCAREAGEWLEIPSMKAA